jgi:hypothetical protein
MLNCYSSITRFPDSPIAIFSNWWIKDIIFYLKYFLFSRFLGCVYLRRFMQNHIKTEQGLTGLQSPEPGMIMFRVEGLTCRVISYASNQHQSLHLKLEPVS